MAAVTVGRTETALGAFYRRLPGGTTSDVERYTETLATRWLLVIKASGYKGD